MFDTTLEGAALVAALVEVDTTNLSRDQRLEVALAWGRAESWCTASKAAALASFAAMPSGADPMAGRSESQFAEEYACAARLSKGQAAFDIDEALTLTGPLVGLLRPLERGSISQRHARKIAGVLTPLMAAIEDPIADPALVEKYRDSLRYLVGQLKDYAADHTPAETRARGLAWLIREVPEVAEISRHRARLERRVEHVAEENAMGSFWIYGPIDQTMRAWKALDQAARADEANAAPDDLRTVDHHRLDLALHLLQGALLGARPVEETPRARIPSIQCSLTIDLTTFLGLKDDPAILEGVAISAPYARELLADADFRRVILHPITGELLDRSPRTYRPPGDLAAFVRSRDPVCIVPRCARPSYRCDLDHRESYNHQHPDRGGATTRAGLSPLCRHHHLLKTHEGFTLEPRKPRLEEIGRGEGRPEATAMAPDGLPPLLNWVTALGRRYPVEVTDHRPGTDPYLLKVEGRIRRLAQMAGGRAS